MADQTQDQSKANPTQYVVALTPEQHEARLRQLAAEPKDAPPPTQIEMGGSGTAKASFKDAAGGDVQITSSEWTSTGSVTVEADKDDPMSAKLTPTAPGPGTVTVTGTGQMGSAQASTSVMVIDKVGAPVAGTIEITAEAPAATSTETKAA